MSAKRSAYSRLLEHVQEVRPTANDQPVDDDDNDAGPSNSRALDDDGQAELQEPEEEDADEDDDDDDKKDAQWLSPGYDAHYGGEWPASALDAKKASWREAKWQLGGLGAAKARVAGSSEPSPPPVATAAAASADAVLKRCGVLPALRTAWRSAHGDGPLSAAQASLLGLLTSRVDVHCAGTALDSHAELLPVLALHAVQHIVVTEKMRRRHKRKGLTPQDSGFTRPSVLVLLPFRSHALTFMRSLLSLLPECYEQIENKARFVKEYSEEENATPMPMAKPEDYRELFDGNHDDCFRCALRLTRKAAKLYAPFFGADLIVGSPLGLRTLLGDSNEGKAGKSKRAKRAQAGKTPTTSSGDADWLSSVELCLVGYGDVLQMQNWAHVTDLFELLNNLPKQPRDTDFSRVRPWYLEGDAKRLRQTALLSQHNSAELTALLSRQCSNVTGRVVTLPTYHGVLSYAPQGIRQLFVRFECSDPASESDMRLAAFRERLLPSLLTAMTSSHGGAQTMLLIPQYFDFVRVRELLKAEDVPFVSVSEYSTVQQASRARTSLQKKEVPLLLYTERAHFFRRHKLRGARHLAVYSPPSYAHFYTELMQLLDRANAPKNADDDDGSGAAPAHDATCALLFCALDVYPLQRLVGNQRAARMLTGGEQSFLFS